MSKNLAGGEAIESINLRDITADCDAPFEMQRKATGGYTGASLLCPFCGSPAFMDVDHDERKTTMKEGIHVTTASGAWHIPMDGRPPELVEEGDGRNKPLNSVFIPMICINEHEFDFYLFGYRGGVKQEATKVRCVVWEGWDTLRPDLIDAPQESEE